MGRDTKIEWCDHTFNPWRGCTKISEGCQNCYAELQARRNPDVLGRWGPKGTRVEASSEYWKQPIRWNHQAITAERRARVFVASMADFHEKAPKPSKADTAMQRARERTYGLIEQCAALDWLVLTKRPENVWAQWPESWRFEGPPENLWLGVTGETQQRVSERVRHLTVLSAETRFISLEPMLEPICLYWNCPKDWTETELDWVIVGCESGARRRPFELKWAENVLNQCHRHKVAVFIKQLPAAAVNCPEPVAGVCRHFEHWPAELRVQEWPKMRHAADCMCNDCTPKPEGVPDVQ